MDNDNWTDDTIPTSRVRPGGPSGGAGRPAIPVGVWLLGGIVALLTLTVCGIWALYLLGGQMGGSGLTPTPIIWTPTVVPTRAVTPTPTPTEEPTPTISPGVAIGRYVQVVGTGGYGLSLRSGPGENYTRMDVALEGEVFIVIDGPTMAGGSEWWKVQDRENVEREWWAVGNFLEPVDHP
jgi:hypothetical protein